MKKMIKVISAILCITMILSVMPVYASNSKFITYTVQTLDEYGEISELNEVAYFDGNDLYVPITFLTKYTSYYFNNDSNAFIRKGQLNTSKYGRVDIDFANKKANVYMNPFSKKEYNLHNVYEFGSQTFLPLDQMAGFLKASLTINNNVVRVVNSGYSLVDADYALSKISGEDSVVNYNIDDVIDDIFAGSENAFYISCVLGYFGATVFNLKVSKLDFITNLGDKAEYENFLEKCVTNNDTYLEALTTNEDLINRVNNICQLNKDVQDFSKDMKDVTTVIKDVSEPLKDSCLSNALLYIDARDWNALFDTISTITNFADYYLKLGSMCEDNKNMINNAEKSSSVNKNGLPMHLAIENVQKKYGNDLVKNITSEIGQKLVDEAVDKGTKLALKEVLPSTAVITTFTKVLKLAGIDLASDADYSIMIDLNAKSMLTNDYYNQESALKHKNSNQTEKYRLSTIFFLQSCVETYNAANKLCKKHDLSAKYYNKHIEKINAVLSLYYLSAQSKNFDNFSDMEKNIKNNQNEIKENKLTDNSVEISQEDALNLLNTIGSDIEIQNNLNANSTLCLDDKYYYYYSGNYIDNEYYIDGSIVKENINTGKTENIYYSASDISNLSVYGDYLYFIESNELKRIDKKGENLQIIDSFESVTGDYIINDNKLYTYGTRDYTLNSSGYLGGCLCCIDLDDIEKSTALFYFGSSYYRDGVESESQLSQITILDSAIIIDDTLYFSWYSSMNGKFGVGCVSLNDNTHDASNFEFYFNTNFSGKDMQYANNRLYFPTSKSYFDLKTKSWENINILDDSLIRDTYDVYVSNDCIYYFTRDKIIGFNLDTSDITVDLTFNKVLKINNDIEDFGYFCDSAIYNGNCYINVEKFEYRFNGDGPDGCIGIHKCILQLNETLKSKE